MLPMSDDLDFSQPAGAAKPPPAPKPAAPSVPLYVPAVARAFFESAGKEESVPAGTVFFSENEKANRLFLKRDKMYLLLQGRVVLVVKGRSIAEPQVGEIFGEMAAISDAPRSATAVAKTDCRVISLDDRSFASALSKKPEFALMMLGTMIMRLRGMIANLSGVPSGTQTKEQTRVFDKDLLATMVTGLGEQAVVRYDKGKVIMPGTQARLRSRRRSGSVTPCFCARLGLRDGLWALLAAEKRHADHPHVVRPGSASSIRVRQRGEVERGRLGKALPPAKDVVGLPARKYIAGLRRVRRLAGDHVHAVHRHDGQHILALPIAYADLVFVARLAHDVRLAFVPVHHQAPSVGPVIHRQIGDAAMRCRLPGAEQSSQQPPRSCIHAHPFLLARDATMASHVA